MQDYRAVRELFTKKKKKFIAMSWKQSKGFKFSMANYLNKTNGKLQFAVIAKVIETS
jgi:hypothetical protein